MDHTLYRLLPKMDALIALPACREASLRYGSAFVKSEATQYLDFLRAEIRNGSIERLPTSESMEQALAERLSLHSPYALRRVINATGVILHTNLGRAPLGEAVLRHVYKVAQGYCSLEYNPSLGARDDRAGSVERLVAALAGAEDAMIVNNNAAAIFLLLHAHAAGRRAAISRGELVEIGGSCRVPEILKESGTELVEVGTTNRTDESDYTRAITEHNATVLLKVHASNFRMEGYTKEVSLDALVRLGRAHGCPVFYDAGAAFLLPPEQLGLNEGISVQKCMESGVDAICFSADKLVGSAQAGILLGKKAWIAPLKTNQLARILRPDKLCLAALEASLRFYTEPKRRIAEIPFLKLISMTGSACSARAEALLSRIQSSVPSLSASILPVSDEIGGGALPGVRLEGYAISIDPSPLPCDAAAAILRDRPIPIIPRIQSGGILLSVRTILSGDEDALIEALCSLAVQIKRGESPR